MKVWGFVAALVISLGVFFLPIDIASEARTVSSIAVFAAVLWFTETLPLWVTALAIPALLVIFTSAKPAKVFAPFFDPVIALLLGGLFLGRALQKHGIDIRIANALVSFFGSGPKPFLLGLMISTAFLSFWMSNTATAAMMLPIGVATLAASRLKPDSNYAKAVVLGVGYAATIGGIGTLIGTPPNLIAASLLSKANIAQIGFLDWMVFATPLAIVMTALAWLGLIVTFKPEVSKIKVPALGDTTTAHKKHLLVGSIFALTAFLWLTESIHGIHNSIIAMVPILLFYSFRLLDKDDIGKIGWDVLILVGGGLVLGDAMSSSGVSMLMSNAIVGMLTGQSTFVLFFGISLFAVALTAFVANTATAAILIPIMIPVAQALGVNPVSMAVLIGIVVSFDFVIPTGTPPNAMAYGTGYIKVKDMVKAGLLLSILGALAVSIVALFW